MKPGAAHKGSYTSAVGEEVGVLNEVARIAELG